MISLPSLPGPIVNIIEEYITDTKNAGRFYEVHFQNDQARGSFKIKSLEQSSNTTQFKESQNMLCRRIGLAAGDYFSGLEHYLDAWEGGLKDCISTDKEKAKNKYLPLKEDFELFVARVKECAPIGMVFYRAIQTGSLRLIRHLIHEQKDYVNSVFKVDFFQTSYSAISVAAALGSRKIVKFLVNEGALLPVQNDRSNNPYNVPLHACLKVSGDNPFREKNLKWLIDMKCDVHKRNDQGETLLHLAINNLEFVQQLILAKADVHAVTKNGESVLFRAVIVQNDIVALQAKQKVIIDLLLQEGVLLTNKDIKYIEDHPKIKEHIGYRQVMLMRAFDPLEKLYQIATDLLLDMNILNPQGNPQYVIPEERGEKVKERGLIALSLFT